MEEKKNKMAIVPMKQLFWKMGLPMIISMVLQALYNVIDSIFITNMGSDGAIANQALTLAFPIQLLIIAIGVGTGVGINALLSKSLGEQNKEKVNKIAGTGIFLSICIYIVFLVFGLFGSRWFISLFAGNNQKVIDMGTTYLSICCCFSFGSIGYTVYERLLQSTGKTLYSTISQISGALVNIVLDYVFIYPMQMSVAGAALATIIGQFVSLFIAMYFHYFKNKEIDGHVRYIKPYTGLIKEIYMIGLSATLMQGLLAVMMAGMNAILGLAKVEPSLLIGSFGIYYKIQQIALFSAFGLSNTIISILSFNYGMKDRKRIDECIKYGITDTIIVTLILTIAFELLAHPLASLFGLSGSTSEMIDICSSALKIASVGFVFMGVSVAIQGVLQSIGYALRPLIISLLRLVVFVFPVAYMFTLSDNVTNLVWWTFPIAEVLTSIISVFILKKSYQEKISIIQNEQITDNLIIAISREHGTNGKEIARQVAKELNIAFYDKEKIKEYAITHGFVNKNESEEFIYSQFLSLDINKNSIITLSQVIKEIAKEGNCVIVGRAADYILREDENLVKIFLYAPYQYRVQKVMDIYNDSEQDAKKYINKSDQSRKNYYEVISNQTWGDKENYDLCLDCKLGNDTVKEIICNYVKSLKNTK